MRGAALPSCCVRKDLVSATTAAATAGVNSGKALAAMLNWSGSFTSSQARKNRISLSRAAGEASTWSIVFWVASALAT